MSNLRSTIDDIDKDRVETLKDIGEDFDEARKKITDDRDLIKFDHLRAEIVGGFNRAMDALAAMGPMAEKYEFE